MSAFKAKGQRKKKDADTTKVSHSIAKFYPLSLILSAEPRPLFRHVLRPVMIFFVITSLVFCGVLSTLFLMSQGQIESARKEQQIRLLSKEYQQYLQTGNYYDLSKSLNRNVTAPNIGKLVITLQGGIVISEAISENHDPNRDTRENIKLYNDLGKHFANMEIHWHAQPILNERTFSPILASLLLSLFFCGIGALSLIKLFNVSVLRNIGNIDRNVSTAGIESQIEIQKDSPLEFVKLVETINERTARAKHLRLEAARYFRQVESEKKNMDNFMEQTDAGYIIFDQNGKFMRSYGDVVDRVLYKYFGLNRPDIREVRRLRAHYAKPVGEQSKNAQHYSLTISGKEGEANYTLIEVANPDGSTFLMLMNTTLAYQHEQTLQKALQAEVVAKLTGGISHDINNLLALLSSMLENMKINLLSSEVSTAYISDIDLMLNSIDGAAGITRQLIGYARNHSLRVENIDIREHLRGQFDLFTRSIGAASGINIRPVEGPRAIISADKTMLERAVLNLVANARDAMTSGGEIFCGHRIICLNGQEFVRIFVRNPGGPLDESLLERVFDPFFTTRQGIGGSGLGLAMVRGFAEQVHGYATLINDDGFVEARIDIPVVRKKRQTRAIPRKKIGILSNSARNSLNVVVIDDNALLANAVQKLLLAVNLEARAISTAEEVSAFVENPKDVDLVISDVFMPEMNGTEIAKLLIQNGFQGRVLLHTGSDISKIEGEMAELEQVIVRQKPVKLEVLREIVEAYWSDTQKDIRPLAEKTRYQTHALSQRKEPPLKVVK